MVSFRYWPKIAAKHVEENKIENGIKIKWNEKREMKIPGNIAPPTIISEVHD